MALKVVTWNMNACFRRGQVDAAWEYLQSLDADIALLQETVRPPDSANALWHEVYRGWGTAIVVRSRSDLREIPSVPVGGSDSIPEGYLERSHAGAWVAAEVRIPEVGSVTAVSVYGLLIKLKNGTTYATASVQRSLSDLTPVLDVPRNLTHVIFAGDLNVSPQIQAPDTQAHIAILDRIRAYGLVDCLGVKHDNLVRTYRHQNKADSKPWQLDWVFSSPSLKLTSCEPLDVEEAWKLSDHCPVVAEFTA